jgi:hypothetical protein
MRTTRDKRRQIIVATPRDLARVHALRIFRASRVAGRRYRAGCGPDLLFIRNLVAEKRPQPSGLVPFRGWRRPSSLRGGRRNRSPRVCFPAGVVSRGVGEGGGDAPVALSLDARSGSSSPAAAAAAALPGRAPLSHQRSAQPTHFPERAL